MIPLVVIAAAIAAKSLTFIDAFNLCKEKVARHKEWLAMILGAFLLILLTALIINLRNYLFSGLFGITGWGADWITGSIRFGTLTWIFVAWVVWFADAPISVTEGHATVIAKAAELTLAAPIVTGDLVCSACGTKAEPDSNFCDECGESLQHHD